MINYPQHLDDPAMAGHDAIDSLKTNQDDPAMAQHDAPASILSTEDPA
jgi:hypothetical protein